MSSKMILTNAGREILGLVLGGLELHFTRGAVGDGIYDGDARELTGLVSERKSLPIQSIRTSRTGTCEAVLSITNENQASGFWLREYGLFALHPETGAEVLYSYSNKGNEAGYLEGYDGANPINFALTLVTIIDQAPNITATISTENSYVTISRLEARVQDIFASSSDIAGVWIYGNDTPGRLSPKSWQDFKLSLMGVTDIEALNARIERLEDNLAETLLLLEMKDMYPGYTHYIIEDFQKPDQVDQFACTITSIVAGDDSLDCTPIDGIYPGSWYTVTDGINAENVQVHSVTIENGIQRIILEDVIQNTYNLSTCRMYRTSAGITAGGAVGAGLRKSITWLPDFEWQGTEANEIQTEKLDISAGNTRSFELSDYCTITSSGGLTLTV